jgi:hypothetical protein
LQRQNASTAEVPAMLGNLHPTLLSFTGHRPVLRTVRY